MPCATGSDTTEAMLHKQKKSSSYTFQSPAGKLLHEMAAVTHEREVKNVVMFSGEYGRLKIFDAAIMGRFLFLCKQ